MLMHWCEGKVKEILFKHGLQLLVFDNKDRHKGLARGVPGEILCMGGF